MKHQTKGPTFTLGDFNARIQRKMTEAETPIGPHTFDKHNTRTQETNVRESREIFVNHCIETDCKIMNTTFEKPDEKLMTHRENFTNREPPYTRGNYETLDYIIVPER